MNEKDVLRILDANFNRSREGLRVCEDIARFLVKDKALTRLLKKTRHDVSDCLKEFSVPQSRLIATRDVRADFGKEASVLESRRRDAADLFLANAERAKESLRVLEEASKFLDVVIATKLKKIRFSVYGIEKRALPKLEALRHRRSRHAKTPVA